MAPHSVVNLCGVWLPRQTVLLSVCFCGSLLLYVVGVEVYKGIAHWPLADRRLERAQVNASWELWLHVESALIQAFVFHILRGLTFQSQQISGDSQHLA